MNVIVVEQVVGSFKKVILNLEGGSRQRRRIIKLFKNVNKHVDFHSMVSIKETVKVVVELEEIILRLNDSVLENFQVFMEVEIVLFIDKNKARDIIKAIVDHIKLLKI